MLGVRIQQCLEVQLQTQELELVSIQVDCIHIDFAPFYLPVLFYILQFFCY